MQLGARWRVGDPPHPGVPDPLHDTIRAVEAEHPGAVSWTLTWLEGRPRCALDDRVLITVDASGTVLVGETSGPAYAEDHDLPDEDDDWLGL